MNKIISHLAAPALALLAMTACDNISEDDRYIPVPPVEAARVVLIEDFTGQNCINCPDAHLVIEQLEEQYPGAIVAVSIHAGSFGIDKSLTDFDSNYIGLKTQEGQALNDSYGIDYWPAGVINRSGGAREYDKWATAVRDIVSTPADVALEILAVENNGEINIDLTLEPQADINGTLNVWVLESNIIARQRSTSGLNREYVHNHVFRAPVTDLNGNTITLKNGIHQTASFSIPVRNNAQERWNVENLSIVAFVSDASGVHQTAIAPVQTQSQE